ncbi:MAG: hypothetical protein VR73_16160 [Gammaproteobacteria bacterium BRH_c0]|jgi:Cu/Ag efflux pump CusA|nr:MAG: hypothetical protein VR73_16160 [Gammaproteobacteria bacterium BRH_c0]
MLTSSVIIVKFLPLKCSKDAGSEIISLIAGPMVDRMFSTVVLPLQVLASAYLLLKQSKLGRQR